MIALLLTIILGSAALLLDLGGRLFGTYIQTPFQVVLRIAIVTAAGLIPPAPALLSLLWTPENPAFGLWLSAGLSAAAVAFFLFPPRFGFRRGRGDATAQVEPLVPGIELRTETVADPHIPAGADGFECLVLSDIHCNWKTKLELVRAVVGLLRDETPDCVFLVGDLGECNSLLPEIFAVLAELPEKHGKYLVRGNHDFEGGRQRIVEELAQAHGIHLLANETHALDDVGICLVGLESPWNKEGTPEVKDGGFVIGLTHTPDNLIYFSRWKVPLWLAGHTHGGKLRLPLIGALLAPCQFGRVLDCGWFHKDASRMFVTKGIGYFPGRFGGKGEVLRLRLKRVG